MQDTKPTNAAPATRTARVILVDDSAIVRQVLQAQLSRQPGIEVVATAADPFAAREKILELKPDCVVLDIEMPRMDGLTFLKKLMKFHPVPTIICSSITPKGCTLAVECLEAGAFEVVSKPGGNFSVGDVATRLAELIRAATHAPKAHAPSPVHGLSAVNALTPAQPKALPTAFRPGLSDKLVAIGTSTGGTEALREVLAALPVDVPPIVMVQHMP
ncbi:MAG: hypothetical protein RL325_424, partial [Planctomycetota bacterium]